MQQPRELGLYRTCVYPNTSKLSRLGDNMKLKYLLLISFFAVIMCLSLASAEEIVYNVKIKQGWNLVYGDTTNDVFGLSMVARYRWVNPINKNILFYPESFTTVENEEIYKITNEDETILNALAQKIGPLNAYFEDDADWIYFNKESTISFIFNSEVYESLDVITIKLFKGWNTKTIMPWMIGKTVDDFRGNCDINDVAIYDANNDNWLPFMSENFHEDMVMGGFAIKVDDNCILEFDVIENTNEEGSNETIPSQPIGGSIV